MQAKHHTLTSSYSLGPFFACFKGFNFPPARKHSGKHRRHTSRVFCRESNGLQWNQLQPLSSLQDGPWVQQEAAGSGYRIAPVMGFQVQGETLSSDLTATSRKLQVLPPCTREPLRLGDQAFVSARSQQTASAV